MSLITRAGAPGGEYCDRVVGTVTQLPNDPAVYDFDSFVLQVKLRFKNSQYSGSEWRTSVALDVYKQGKIVQNWAYMHSVANNLGEVVVKLFGAWKLRHVVAPMKIEFFRKGRCVGSVEGDDVFQAFDRAQDHACNVFMAVPFEEFAPFCDQHGCASPWTNSYKIKQRFCTTCSSVTRDCSDHTPGVQHLVVRNFCVAHSNRGDASFEDSNKNYELIQGNGVATIDPAIVSVPALVIVR
jgi:hypothetical protein